MPGDASFTVLIVIFAISVLCIGTLFAYLFVHQTNESLLIRYGLALDHSYDYKQRDLFKPQEQDGIEKPEQCVVNKKSSFLMDVNFKRIDHLGSVI